MIRVAVEVRGGVDSSRMVVRAESISAAVDLARGDHLMREVRVVFPIDAEAFFEPGRAPDQNGSDPPGERTPAGELHQGAVVYEGRSTGRRDV